jgi:hypothetical protein
MRKFLLGLFLSGSLISNAQELPKGYAHIN